jgi:hypothetical protein
MNDLIKLVRQQFPDDPRSDQRLTYELGQLAEQSKPEWFEQFPEFAAQYRDIQRSLRPSLREEFVGSVGQAADNLQATTIGAGALAADALGASRLAAYLAEQAAEQERQAAEFKPSVGSYKDVDSLADSAYYVIYGLGQLVPAGAESAVMAGAGALAGAAAGSTVSPGAGTAGGALAGGLAGFVARTASRNLLRAGIKDLTTELGKAAFKKEARSVASSLLAKAGLAAASIPQSVGEIYNDTGDVGISASMGTLAGVLDLLPESYVLSKFFKPGTKVAEKEASRVLGYVKRLGVEASKTMPMEGSTEAAQEFINFAAEKWSRGEPASITDTDVERFVNAGLIGAIGGGMFAPVAALGQGREAPQGAIDVETTEVAAPAPAVPVAPITAEDLAGDIAGAPPAVAGAGAADELAVGNLDQTRVEQGENMIADAVQKARAAVEAAANAERQAQENEAIQLQLEQQRAMEVARAMMGNIPVSANQAPAIEARQAAEREAARRLGVGMMGGVEPDDLGRTPWLGRVDSAAGLNEAVDTDGVTTPVDERFAEEPIRRIGVAMMGGTPDAPQVAPQVTPQVAAPVAPSTAPVVSTPADLNSLSIIRELRNQPLSNEQRVQSVAENTGRSVTSTTNGAVFLDRATGRVHVKPVYQNKKLMVGWAQARTASSGKQGPGRALDFDAATEGASMQNVLAATLEDGSPRFELIGATSYRDPSIVQPLTFNSLDEYEANPAVAELMKLGFETPSVPQGKRTRQGRIPNKQKVSFDPIKDAVSLDERAAISAGDTVGERERSMEQVGIVDEDAEAQRAGVRSAPAEEPAIEQPAETPEAGSRKVVMALASAIKQGAGQSDLLPMAKAELARHGITEKSISAASQKVAGKTITLDQLASHIVALAEDMAERLENLTRRAASGFRMAESDRLALFQNLLDAIRASGGEVAVFEQKLTEGLTAWQQASGFQLTQADGRSLIGLALNSLDVRDPDAVVVLAHEAAHHFIEKALPDPTMRLKFQSAVAQLPWTQQRWLMNPLSTDLRLLANADPATLSEYQKSLLAAVPPAEIEKLRATSPDVLLVEQAAEHLAMLGLDRGASRGLMAKIIRAVKDLMLRTAMAVQRTLKGDGAVSDRLARQFVENRWLQFVNRDFAQGRDVISSLRNWIGAPATFRERAAECATLSGDPRTGDVDLETGLWNPAEFVPETPEQLADKLQVAIVNRTVRASIKQAIRYTPEVQVNSEFAAINYVDESLSSIWARLSRVAPRAVQESENPAAKFLADYMGVRVASAPSTMREALLRQAAGIVDPITGQKIQFNPATQINQLTPTVSEVTDAEGRVRKVELASAQHYAMDAALSRLYGIRNRVQNKVAKDMARYEKLERRKNLSEKEAAEKTKLSQDLAILERVLNEPDAGLNWRIGQLEARRGVTVPDVFYPGAEYRVPNGDTSAPSGWTTRKLPRDMRFSQQQKEQFIAGLAAMRRWLDNEENMKFGLEYNRMLQQWKRLSEHFSTEYVYNAVTFNMRRSFTVGLVDMFRDIGTPAAVHAGRIVNEFQAKLSKHQNDGRILGSQWAESYEALAKAMGRRMDESFREDIWDVISRVYEQINEGSPNAFEIGRAVLDRHYGIKLDGKAKAALADLIRNTRRVQMWRRDVFNDFGLKVEDDALGGVQRSLRDLGYFNGQRTISRSLESLYLQMRDKWSATDEDGASPLLALAGNPAALKEFFTDRVIADFVEPLIRGNHEFITFREPTEGGRTRPVGTARQDLVREAWAEADGDVVAFARALHRLSERTNDPESQTISDVLESFLGMHNQVKKQVEQRLTAESNGMEVMQRQMMDGRQADNWPPEWVSYSIYNNTSNFVFLMQSALNSAFGRNGFGAGGEFSALISSIEMNLRELRDQEESLRKSGLDEKEVRRRMGAEEYRIALQSRDHLDMLRDMREKLKAITKTTGYQLADMRLFADLMHLQASAMLQQPRTSLINMTDLLAPFYKTKFSTVTFSMMQQAFRSIAADLGNSVGTALGFDVAFNSDIATRRKRAGVKDPDNYVTFRQKIADAKTRFAPGDRPEGALEQAGRATAIGIRMAREVINVGRNEIVPNSSSKALSPKFRPFGVFSATSQMITNALVDSLYHGVSDLATRGVEHIERNGGASLIAALESGQIRLDPEALGYNRKWGFLNDRAAYDYLADALTTKMAERSVEDFVVKAWKRMKAANGAPWEAVDGEQFVRVANVAANEFSIQANAASAPIGLMTNPLLRTMSVFLVWPWMAMVRSARAFRTPQGKITTESMLDGFTLMMMGAVPATLAASLMVDFYDEKVVGKRSNLRNLSVDDPMAILERLARYGTFGLLSEAVNGAINFDDARGGFSADNRIFIFSQFNTIRNLFGNLYQQDGEMTYQSVGRPLIQFMGLNGVLQYTQIANKQFDLKNEEASINERINAGNYLRAMGRSLDLDVRVMKGAQSIPTPVTPYIQQMELAATTNNDALFRQAYAKAIQMAAREGKEDPADDVRRAFASRHPLRRIFRTLPSEGEYRSILSNLNDEGRTAVARSVTSYNSYLDKLHMRPVAGKKEKAAAVFSAPKPAMSLEQARALAAQAAWAGSGLY